MFYHNMLPSRNS